MIHQLLQGDGRHILGIGGGGKPQLVGCHRQSLWPEPFVHNHPRGFITIAEALDGWEGQRQKSTFSHNLFQGQEKSEG